MRHRKKVVWNSGQVPDRHPMARMLPYRPPKEIIDDTLRHAWEEVKVGDMLTAIESYYIQPNDYHVNNVPYPVMYPGVGGYGYADPEILPGTLMVYLGTTNVDCAGAKGRTISKPYATVFYNGKKYLINDQNYLKPLSL